jgi:hypothetical protein
MSTEIVKSYPTKTLFIDVLTRDLDLHACIMDLLDNSIDSYKRHGIETRQEIKITLSNEKFEIYDSCGGIEKEILLNQAFVFGAEKITRDKKTIGLFGIGMKRAIFKIGKKIDIVSNDSKYLNSLKIDVEKWKNDKNIWDFEANSTISQSNSPKGFTRITITDLLEITKIMFMSNSFIEKLKDQIHIMYTIFIKDHVDIFINGIKIIPFDLEITFDNNYKPARHKEIFEDVEIDIICGIEPHKGRTIKETGRRGWNVFINDRLILSDDTSTITGWDALKGLLPNYHQIYNEFRGLVFLSSNDPFKLPLNTKKDGLNMESMVYHFMLKNMVNTARPVINHLTKKYDAQKLLSDNIEDSILSQPVESTEKVDLNSLPSGNIVFTAPTQKLKLTTTISYQKTTEIVAKVRNHLGVKTNNQVGVKTFDYFVKHEEIK